MAWVRIFSAIASVLLASGCIQIVGGASTSSETPIQNFGSRLDLVAGTYTNSGFLDGQGTQAMFHNPGGITSDGVSLFVVDSYNYAIRKIDLATYNVTTLAGNGGAGSSDGIGVAAQFNFPSGITTDGVNLYVADSYNNRIRKVVIATGAVTTFAGDGNAASADGIGTAASLNNPCGITADSANLYVTDCGSSKIRKIQLSSANVTTLFPGDVNSDFNGSGDGIATIGGVVYYLDTAGAPAGTIKTVQIGSGVTGAVPGSCTSDDGIGGGCFTYGWGVPGGLTTDGTFLYVLSVDEKFIRKVNVATGAVVTLAGSKNSIGSNDGVGSSASFNFFNRGNGLVYLGGLLYFPDSGNNTIRRLNPATGQVTTIAGRSPGAVGPGSQDGNLANARFNRPIGIASAGGNVYVADANNNTIREISPGSGTVTTLAGRPGIRGSSDGVGASASFNLNYGAGGLASDGINLYIADYFNSTVRKLVISTGQVTTIAGTAGSPGTSDGVGAAARFMVPSGLALIGTKLYVADPGWPGEIRKIDLATNTVSTVISSGQYLTRGLATDGVNLYTLDANSQSVVKIVIATQTVTTIAGGTYGYADGIGTAAEFQFHTGGDAGNMAAGGIACEGANLYVVDGGNYVIRKIVISTGMVTTLAGTPDMPGVMDSSDGAGADAEFQLYDGLSQTGQIATDGTYLYVADTPSNTIRRILISSGDVSTLAGQAPYYLSELHDASGSQARMDWPMGMVSLGGKIYFVDYDNNVVRELDPVSGAVSTLAGSPGIMTSVDGIGTAAGFEWPWGMTSDGIFLYVADGGSNVIRKIDPTTAAVTTFAGTAGVTGHTDAVGAAASFNFNWTARIASDGTNLYVTDVGNATIRQVNIATQSVTTLAGTAGVTGVADGIGAAAQFMAPFAIATDGSNVYVGDSISNTIRKIAISSNTVTTLAGTAGIGGFADGSGTGAQFNFNGTGGISTDGVSLYVADTGNNAIRKVSIGTGAVTTLVGGMVQGCDIDGYISSGALVNEPLDILVSGGEIFIAESLGIRVYH